MTLDRVGQQVGKYRLLRLLGRGAFAEVYLGEHQSLKSQAAIKVLHNQLMSNDVDAFMKEARTIARLEHPQIVHIFDFEVQDGTPFIVMNYVPNGTLRERHPVGTPVPLQTVVSYVRQVSDALQYAHNEKVIHRDIKPENMLLGRRNEIVLSDFGIAIVWQSSRYQSTQDIAGTIGYMAPEQFQGHPVPASDQYALGVLVYEWLCGDRPFNGTSIEIAGQHLSAAPPSLLKKLPTLPSSVEAVVLTALAKDPKRRFGSIQAFARAFEQASQVEPTRAKMEQRPQIPPQVMPTNSIPPFNNLRQPSPTTNFASPPILPPLQPYSGNRSTYVTPPAKKAVAMPQLPGKILASRFIKSNSVGKRVLFVALAVLLILAGSVTIFSHRDNNLSGSPVTAAVAAAASAASGAIAIAVANATATAAANNYNSMVAYNGAMFGFDAQQTRYNPDEKVIGKDNVRQLVLYWTAST